MTSFAFDQPPPIPGHMPPLAPAVPAPARPRPSGSSRSLIVWGCLGLLALGYLALAVARPEILAGMMPQSGIGAAETNEGQRANTGSVAEIDRIRDSISQLQSDVGQLKSDVAETVSQNKEISARLAAIAEPANRVAAGPAGTPDSAERPATAASTSPSQLPPAELRLEPARVNAPIATKPFVHPSLTIVSTDTGVSVTQRPAAPAAEPVSNTPKLINAPLPSETKAEAKPAPAAVAPPANALETGSVKTAAPAAPAPVQTAAAAAPAVPKPPAKPVGLQIASAPNLDALRLSWSLLSETHADSLKNLQPRYSTGVDANGLTYNLLAGPVKSAAEAKKMCKALAAQAIACKVIGEFGGEAL